MAAAAPPAVGDVQLQDHLVRVQETLLDAVDKEVGAARAELRLKDAELSASEAGRKKAAVEAYQHQRSVDRLNDLLAAVRSQLDAATAELRTADADRQAADKDYAQSADQNKLLHQELSIAHKTLLEMTEKIDRLGQINAAYNVNLKIQKRINSKAEKDRANAEAEKTRLAGEVESMCAKMEKMTKENKDLQSLLSGQKHANIIAQGAVSKMKQEIADVADLKKTTEKQWEEALMAMMKRDVTLQNLETQQKSLKNKLKDANLERRALKRENDGATKTLAEKQSETEALRNKLDTLSDNIGSLEAKQQSLRDNLSEAQTSESVCRQEFESLNLRHELAEEELHRKTSEIGNLKKKLEHMKEKFEMNLKDTLIVECARHEERARSQGAKELTSATRDYEARNVDLRQENVHLRARVMELEQELVNLTADRNALDSCYKEVNGHYVNMYNEAKYLVHALERKEHDTNLYKGKLLEIKEGGNVKPLQIAIGKLRKELDNSLAQNDKLQSLWVESQKNAFKLQETINKVTADNSFLSTQLGINETIKEKTKQETDAHKHGAIEQRMETSRMYIELKKLQPLVDELKQKNLVLENRLMEQRRQTEERRNDQDTAVAMLKAEIRRLYDDRKQLRNRQCEDVKSTQAMERRFILNKERFDRISVERKDLQKENFALRARGDAFQRKYVELRREYEKLSGLLAKTAVANAGKGAAAAAAIGPAPGEEGGGGGPREENGAARSAGPTPLPGGDRLTEAYEAPDIDGMKLTIEKLAHERAHRESENQVLKRKLEELSKRFVQMERQVGELLVKHAALETKNKQAGALNETLRMQCQRAQKLASYIEKQYKEAKPNTKIDFDYPPETEPSTHLAAALAQKEMSEAYKKGAQTRTDGRLLPTLA